MTHRADWPCHLCGSRVSDGRPSEPLPGDFKGFAPVHYGCVKVHDEARTGPLTTVACSHCGLVQTLPHPTRQEVAKYYSSGQYRRDFPPLPVFELTPDLRPTGRMVEPTEPGYSEALDLGAASVARRLVDTFQIAKTDRILEVGCGDGRVSAALVRMGFSVSAVEQDPNLRYAASERCAWAYAERWPVRMGEDLAELPGAPVICDAPERAFGFGATSPPPFDFVFALQVLEHFPSPVADLYTNLVRYAKPGTGVVCVEVPTVERPYVSLAHFLQKPHVVNFSTHTLGAALKMAGLTETVVKIEGSVLIGAGVRTGEPEAYVPHGGPSGEQVAAELQAWEARRLANPKAVVQRFVDGEDMDEAEMAIVRDDFLRWAEVGSHAVMSIGAPHGICALYDSAQDRVQDWHPDPWVRGYLAGRIYESQRASRMLDHLTNELLMRLNRPKDEA